MRGVVMHTAGDVRVEDRDDPKIIEPTDAIVKLTATCICGSDLWPYRGIEPADHTLMGHEYVGVVEEVGAAVKTVKPGDFTREYVARQTAAGRTKKEIIRLLKRGLQISRTCRPRPRRTWPMSRWSAGSPPAPRSWPRNQLRTCTRCHANWSERASCSRSDWSADGFVPATRAEVVADHPVKPAPQQGRNPRNPARPPGSPQAGA